jgi:hypothetical protein
MSGRAAATIAAIAIGLMIRGYRSLGPEFRRQNDRSIFDRSAAACMFCGVHMCMGSADMSSADMSSPMRSRAGRRERDQEQGCQGHDGRCDGPDGHDALLHHSGIREQQINPHRLTT